MTADTAATDPVEGASGGRPGAALALPDRGATVRACRGTFCGLPRYIVMIMARILALAVVLLGLLGAAPATGKVADLYAFRYGAKMNVLVPYDPVRLVPSGRAVRMGHFAHAWSISPERSRLVAAAGWRPTKGEPAALRFVDLATGRVEGTLRLAGESRRVTATAWLRGRVLAIVSGSRATTVYSLDPDRRAMVAGVEVPGVVVLGERARDRLVLLLAPPKRIGPAIVAVVDRSARARTVVLDEIAAGTTVTGMGPDRRTTVRRPALALSPSGLQAFVFGAGAPAASIDLRTLAIRYAPLRLLAAVSKRFEGSVRTAATLPDGRVVVGGFDQGARAGTNLGVWLVDPKDWSRRVLAADATWFRVAGGLIFARGEGGVGLRILRPSGTAVELFRTGSVGSVTVVGPRALVTFFGTNQKAAVIELGTGRVVRRTVPAHPLVGAGQPIVG